MKKIVSILLSVVMVFSILPLNVFTVNAETEYKEGHYTYTVSYSEATIIDCDVTISGNVIIPSKLQGKPVRNIDDYAFSGCCSLNSITIPSSVTSIGYMAFYNCSSLSDIMVDNNNNSYTSCNGVLFNKDKTVLICYPLGKTTPSYTLPDGIKRIDDYAFTKCSALASIIIPDGLEYIGDYAFAACSSLISITIPNSVTKIEWGAFFECSSLTSFTIPNNVSYISNSTFARCSSLTSIIIPRNVTYIYPKAFENCQSLESIIIPDSITDIADYAFNLCYALKTVYYYGTEEEWNNISIGNYNNNLISANILYSNSPEHLFGAWQIRSNPTCITNGEEFRICIDCGIEETRSISAFGHTYNSIVTLPTCTEQGYTTYTCANCDNKYVDNYTLALGHRKKVISFENSRNYPFSLNNNIYSSTNKTNNSSSTFTIHALINCNLEIQYYTSSESRYDELTITHNNSIKVTDSGIKTSWQTLTLTLNAGDNIYIKYSKDSSVSKGDDSIYFKLNPETISTNEITPTCVSGVYCDVCNCMVKPPSEHSYSKLVITKSTCTEQGYTSYTCTDCGNSYIDNYTEALGHDFDTEFTIDKPVTETENGSKSRHCTRCDEITDVTVIPRKIILYRYREKTFKNSTSKLDKPWILYNTKTEHEHTGIMGKIIAFDNADEMDFMYSCCLHSKEFVNFYFYTDYWGGTELPNTGFYATESEFMAMDAVDTVGYRSNGRTYYRITYCTSIKQNTEYYYYKWSDWNTWSETPYSASENVEVEKIQTYDETLDSENLITLRKTLFNDENNMLLDYNADEKLDLLDLICLKNYLLSV